VISNIFILKYRVTISIKYVKLIIKQAKV